MEWIVTTARSVDEARIRALDLLGVDADDAEIQVIEEGKTGLFGRTKTEARVRARIKPKAPPVKDERRQGRNDNRNRSRNRNRGGRGGQNKGGNQGKGGQNKGGNQGKGGQNRDNDNKGRDNKGGQNKGGNRGRDTAGAAAAGAAAQGGGRNRNRNRDGGNTSKPRSERQNRNDEDRVEMPIAEQRETLEAFVTGVAKVFDPSAKVELVEEGTTLLAKVNGGDLGRLIGQKAQTLQTLEELSRTAMHRAAAGRRYHRIQVDVDDYRARRREALARFATDLAESVAASGESKAMEPMGAADRKLVHDAVGEVAGVETVSEGRDPRRYIVIVPIDGGDEEE